ncbi:hypothetical protein [Marinovum sp.]|uniref:hypothetical protein n=1 Tax=Marinovum sp. TaxID=2024839 RepID=UPI003A92F800
MTNYTIQENFHSAELKEGPRDPDAHSVLNAPNDDACACRKVLLGLQEPEEAVRRLSTSEAITIALAFGRDDLLPGSHRDFRSAWRRLDNRQRRLVDAVARAKWATNFESPACGG